MTTPLLIDCDPGIDDAVMLIMALGHADLDVRAITTLAGNVPLRLTSRNARMLCEMMGRADIPVYAGADRPLVRAPVTAAEFHGESGIAGITPFEPPTPLRPGHAVSAIHDALVRAEDGLTILATGPLTNIALALLDDPQPFANLKALYVMGGADTEGGNITPTAEFNIFADPHAAGLVFDAGLPTTLISLDVTHTIRATPERIARLAAINTGRARWCVSLLEQSSAFEIKNGKVPDAPMHDPAALAALIAPELFQTRAATIRVETGEGENYGRTYVEGSGGPHHWATHGNANGFFDLLESLVKES